LSVDEPGIPSIAGAGGDAVSRYIDIEDGITLGATTGAVRTVVFIHHKGFEVFFPVRSNQGTFSTTYFVNIFLGNLGIRNETLQEVLRSSSHHPNTKT
jgi:hypothetical protein